MSVTIALNSPDTITGGGMFRTMLRWIRGTSSLSDAQKNLILDLAARVSAPLLAAEGIDDLEAELEGALESEDFAEWLRVIPSILKKQTVAAELAEVTEAPAELVNVFGCEALLSEGFRLGSIVAQVMLQSPLLQVVKTEPEMTESPLLAFLHDPRTPTAIARVLLASLVGDVCGLAIIHIDATRNRPAPWLARALAERWVHGLREYLRLLASIPELKVNYKHVPKRERIDLETADHLATASDDAFNELLQRARESGESVYPPFNANDQD